MLGKLIKHSFRSNLSAVYTIYITMACMGIVLGLLIALDFTSVGTSGSVAALISKVVVSAALCVTAVVAVLLTLVAVFSDFTKSMYGKQGHLTMSLPVRSSSLLLSKWIAGTGCILISYIALYLSLIFCASSVLGDLLGYINAGDNESYNIYAIAWQFITYAVQASGNVLPDKSIIFTMVNLYAFKGAIQLCIFVLLVFFSLTLSKVRPFNSLKGIGPILYFFGGNLIVSGFSRLVAKLINIYLLIDADYAFTFTISESDVALAWSRGLGAFPVTSIYCTVIMSIAVFLLTALLIDRKINVD